jgi:hypothetical protein
MVYLGSSSTISSYRNVTKCTRFSWRGDGEDLKFLSHSAFLEATL